MITICFVCGVTNRENNEHNLLDENLGRRRPDPGVVRLVRCHSSVRVVFAKKFDLDILQCS